MEKIEKIENIENLILEIRGERVILDRDVAKIYGVETKRINEAVKNNGGRFPKGYVIELNSPEKNELVENFDQFKMLKHTITNPKAFTEKGLYMLATILNSERAIETTIQIVETFAKIKELSRNVNELTRIKEKEKQENIMQRSGELFAEILDNNLEIKDSETSIELNLAVLKLKHVVKKKKE